MYEELSTFLPPNLAPSTNKPTLPTLTLSIPEIAYLQTSSPKATKIRYKWWGLSNKKIEYALLPNAHTFFISVSEQMFIRYCLDMKVLEFQLTDSVGKGVARGAVNFGVLGGWAGQEVEVLSDLRGERNGAKIGEIKIKMAIGQAQNPLYMKPEPTAMKNGIQTYKSPARELENDKSNINIQTNYIQTNKKAQRNTFARHQIDDSVNQERNTHNFLNYRTESELNQHNEKETRQILSKKGRRDEPIPREDRREAVSNDDTKTRLYKKLQLPLPDDCICDQINSNKFRMERLRLREEIDLFFNNYPQVNNQEINLELLGWRSSSKNDVNLACKVIIPVLENQGKVYRNEYSFAKGTGLIKLRIDTQSNNQGIVKDYLTENTIEIVIGDYVGQVPLYRVIGSKGEIVSVGVYDRKGKKEALKGHFLIKLIPSRGKEDRQQGKKEVQEIKIKPQPRPSSQTQIQPPPTMTPDYIWLYLRQLYFLEPHHWQDSNIFAIIKAEKTEHRTKTIWKTDSPLFNEIVTLKMPKQELIIEFWNRKTTDRLIGKACVKVKDRFQYVIEVPVEDSHGRVEAYVNLCVGKGDISAATQFLNTHARIFTQPPNQHKKQESNAHDPSQIHERTQEQPQHPQYSQPSEHSIQEQSSQVPQQSSSQSQEPIPRPNIREQPQLGLITIHNKIFTKYIGKQHDWLPKYQNRRPSLAEFTHLIKPLANFNPGQRGSLNITKLASLYLDSKENTVSIDQIQQSEEAFEVYYDILYKERDEAMRRAIECMNQQGITVNGLQNNVKSMIKNGKKENFMWRAMKQNLDANVVEHLRYFYEKLSIEQLCDGIRKFEVYETTRGEQVEAEIIKRQVMKEITELLDLDPHSPGLRASIKEAGLQLSKFELLCLFDEVPKKKSENQMVKSPTFGFLATDRMAPPRPLPLQDNSSLAFNLEKQSLNNLSQKFGNPNISPINQNPLKSKSKVKLQFMDFNEFVQEIHINQKAFQIGEEIGDGSLELQIEKKFNFQGFIKVQGKGKLEFDGPVGQWIGLVDQNGDYCGCINFQ